MKKHIQDNEQKKHLFLKYYDDNSTKPRGVSGRTKKFV